MIGKLRSTRFLKLVPISHSFVAPANWVEDDLLLQVDQGSAKKAALEQQRWQFFLNDKGWTQHFGISAKNG